MLGMDGCWVLTEIFVPRKGAKTEDWRKFKNVHFIVSTPRQTLLIQ